MEEADDWERERSVFTDIGAEFGGAVPALWTEEDAGALLLCGGDKVLRVGAARERVRVVGTEDWGWMSGRGRGGRPEIGRRTAGSSSKGEVNNMAQRTVSDEELGDLAFHVAVDDVRVKACWRGVGETRSDDQTRVVTVCLGGLYDREGETMTGQPLVMRKPRGKRHTHNRSAGVVLSGWWHNGLLAGRAKGPHGIVFARHVPVDGFNGNGSVIALLSAGCRRSEEDCQPSLSVASMVGGEESLPREGCRAGSRVGDVRVAATSLRARKTTSQRPDGRRGQTGGLSPSMIRRGFRLGEAGSCPSTRDRSSAYRSL